MHDGDYLVIIDDKKLHSIKDTLDYLRDLYDEICLQINVNAHAAIRSIKKASTLFNSNNRTLSYKE